MRFRFFIVSLLLNNLLLGQQANFEKNISITTSLSTDTIAIGDQVILNIKVVIPANFQIKFPLLKDSVSRGIEVIKRSVIDSANLKDNLKELTFKTIISSYDSGFHTIPSLPLVINNDTVFTDSLLLAVYTLPRDTTIKEIYDIKQPISEPLTFAEVAPWAGGGLILAALIFLLILYIRSRKQNKPFTLIQKPAEPAHIIALRELDKIKHDKLWTSENHKFYYTRLIDIIRQYIESRFSVAAMEQTTDEIVHDLKQVEFTSEEILIQLNDLLILSDLVKFAKFTPLISENEHSLSLAYEFVEKTKQDISTLESKGSNGSTDNKTNEEILTSSELTNNVS